MVLNDTWNLSGRVTFLECKELCLKLYPILVKNRKQSILQYGFVVETRLKEEPSMTPTVKINTVM